MPHPIFELFIDDLTEHAQEALLEFLGLGSPEAANLDTDPIFILDRKDIDIFLGRE